jgi:hypothetical protein
MLTLPFPILMKTYRILDVNKQKPILSQGWAFAGSDMREV